MRALCLLPIVLLGLAGTASAENKFFPKKDPMTDAVGGNAILNMSGTVLPAVTCAPAPATEHHLNVAFFSKQDLGYLGEQAGTVKVRIDGGAPFDLTGTYTPQGILVEAGAKPGSPGGQLLDKFRTAKHMVVQLAASDGSAVTDDFDLGNDAASTIDQAVTVCHDPAWAKAAKSSR